MTVAELKAEQNRLLNLVQPHIIKKVSRDLPRKCKKQARKGYRKLNSLKMLDCINILAAYTDISNQLEAKTTRNKQHESKHQEQG